MNVKAVRLKFFICGFISFLLLSESGSQTVTFPFNGTQQTSVCKDGGVIESTDRVTYYGQVDTTGASPGIQLLFVFETKDSSLSNPVFVQDCEVDIDKNGCSSTPAGVSDCYCSDNQTNVYTLVYNKPAELANSAFKIRLYWPGPKVQDKEIDMPFVHPEGGPLSDSVNCTNQYPGKDCCPYTLKQSNQFTFCEPNLQHPTLSIEFKGVVEVTSTSGCVSYGVKGGDADTPLIFHYNEGSGCQRNGSYTCPPDDAAAGTTQSNLPTRRGKMSFTTVKTGVSSEQPEPPACWCNLECLPCPWCCILIIISTVVSVVLSIMLATTILHCKAAPKKKAGPASQTELQKQENRIPEDYQKRDEWKFTESVSAFESTV